MRLSVSMFGAPIGAYADVARCADELGYEALWIPEHLALPLDYAAKYPYQASGKLGFEPDTPFADPWVMFGHLAAVTKQLQLGVGVFVLPLRNPFVVAKAAATAQILSNGRVLMGVGIGWMKEEFDAVGERFERRASRMEEMMQVMNLLWTGKPVEHEGEFYQFRELQMSPGLDAPMPMIIGGASDAAIRRAARIGNGWYGPPETLEQAKASHQRLLGALATAGRDGKDFSLWFRPAVAAGAAIVDEFREAGFDRMVIALPRTLTTTAERVQWLEQAARWNA